MVAAMSALITATTVWQVEHALVTIHPNPGPALRVTGYLGNSPVSVLLDSGADFSGVNKKFADFQRKCKNKAVESSVWATPINCELAQAGNSMKGNSETTLHNTFWGLGESDKDKFINVKAPCREFDELNEKLQQHWNA